MARIGILTCSNATQESNCGSVVCLGDMRKRGGFFNAYFHRRIAFSMCTTSRNICYEACKKPLADKLDDSH